MKQIIIETQTGAFCYAVNPNKNVYSSIHVIFMDMYNGKLLPEEGWITDASSIVLGY